MDRASWEHVIAAAAEVTGLDAFVVIGSQAILGPFPDAPEGLLRSQETDLYPRDDPERAIEVEGALGDGSPFAQTYGYYAHAVGPQTATPPKGWQQRLVEVPIPPRVGSPRRPVAYCMEPHDLILAKCAAGRQRDWDFAEQAIKAGLVDVGTLLGRVRDLPAAETQIKRIETWLKARG